MSDSYITSYCNKAHRVKDGKPIQHECRILPTKALALEMAGDVAGAIKILEAELPGARRWMRRGARM